MKTIEQDILSVGKGVICQQVNCQGAMNSGLAKSIRNKWPIVFERYKDFCANYARDFILLGKYQMVPITNDLTVCNIFGQLDFGYDGKRYTDYGALRWAFDGIRTWKPLDWPIYFPFNFGCDRGGADWNIVSKMIDYYFSDAIICQLPN